MPQDKIARRRERCRRDSTVVHVKFHSLVEARFQRLRFDYERNPGALPQAGIEAAPSVLNTYEHGNPRRSMLATVRLLPSIGTHETAFPVGHLFIFDVG